MNRSGCEWRMKFWNWAGNSWQSMCSLLHLPTELLCSGISPSLPSSLGALSSGLRGSWGWRNEASHSLVYCLRSVSFQMGGQSTATCHLIKL